MENQDAENVDQNAQPSNEGAAEGTQPEPTIDEVQSKYQQELAERDRIIQESNSKLAALEQRENERYQREMMARQQPAVVNEGYDTILKQAVEDGDVAGAAAKLAQREQALLGNVGHVIQIQNGVGKVVNENPHLSGFGEDLTNLTGQLVERGYPVNQAIEYAKNHITQKLGGLLKQETPPQQPKQPAEQQTQQPQGEKVLPVNTGYQQQPPKGKQKAEPEESEEDYLNRRLSRQRGRYSIRT